MSDPTDDTDGSDDGHDPELPADVVEEAERLTRLSRATGDEREASAYLRERDELLDTHAYSARVREDDGDAVLVLHPAAWHDEDAGVVRTDRIEDLSRAVERPLEGTGDPDDWDAVDAHNRDLAADVRGAHGDVHGENAAALAAFVSNHYAKRIESLTAPELAEFRTEYFVRNAWPSDAQRAVIDESIQLVYRTAGKPVPDYRSQ